jgi:hypothetical protein
MSLVEQLIAWVAERPRTYAETMEAWRTNCPRMTVWEDANDEGLVRVERAGALNERPVRLTDKGRALLAH